MSRLLFFVQECPTCGRRLQIRVAYLGRQVVCQHCHGHFEARDASTTPLPAVDSSAIMRRAEELLESAERSRMFSE